MDNNAGANINDFIKGQGIIAEASLLFFRAVKHSGASPLEAFILTQAYISAFLFGKQK